MAGAAACASGSAGGRRCRGRWTPPPTRSPTACATRARRCAPGSARPAASSGAGSPARPLAAAGLLAAVWLVASLDQRLSADHQPAAAVRRRRARRRRARAREQHARARAARDGVRGRLHRRQLAAAAGAAPRGLSRWVHEHGGRIAIAFVVCATAFSLSAQAYLLGHTLAGVSPSWRLAGAAAARRAAARDPRADRPVPAARRLDHRQPPRRVGAAARRHRRDRRDRRAACSSSRRSSRSTSPRTCSPRSRTSTRRSCASPKAGPWSCTDCFSPSERISQFFPPVGPEQRSPRARPQRRRRPRSRPFRRLRGPCGQR